MKLQLYFDKRIALSTLTDAERLNFKRELFAASRDDNRWWSDSGLRYSPVHYTPTDNESVVGAWFTQQYPIEKSVYIQDKQRSTVVDESFEERLFLLDFSRNLVALEDRRFQGTGNTFPKMLRRLKSCLNELLFEVKAGARMDLIPVAYSTTRDQFLELFYHNIVKELQVDLFGRYDVKETVQLVNPVPDLEEATRDLIQHDKPYINRAKFDSNSDLRKAAFARAALHSGSPTELRYVDGNSKTISRKAMEKGVVVVEGSISASRNDEKRKVDVEAVALELQTVDTAPMSAKIDTSVQYGVFNSEID